MQVFCSGMPSQCLIVYGSHPQARDIDLSKERDMYGSRTQMYSLHNEGDSQKFGIGSRLSLVRSTHNEAQLSVHILKCTHTVFLRLAHASCCRTAIY